MKAKTNLEKEKTHVRSIALGLQFERRGEIDRKIESEIKNSSKQIKKENVTKIELEKKTFIKEKRELERDILITNEKIHVKSSCLITQVQRVVEHYHLLSRFIRTKVRRGSEFIVYLRLALSCSKSRESSGYQLRALRRPTNCCERLECTSKTMLRSSKNAQMSNYSSAWRSMMSESRSLRYGTDTKKKRMRG